MKTTNPEFNFTAFTSKTVKVLIKHVQLREIKHLPAFYVVCGWLLDYTESDLLKIICEPTNKHFENHFCRFLIVEAMSLTLSSLLVHLVHKKNSKRLHVLLHVLRMSEAEKLAQLHDNCPTLHYTQPFLCKITGHIFNIKSSTHI